MELAIIEDKTFEFEPLEEDGSVLMAAESSWRGMADELQELQVLIYSGNKEVSIKRNIVLSKGFLKMMMNCFR